jgi:PTH1 family peptidyl-tRNA hydrolase
VRYCKKAMKLVVGLGNPGRKYQGTRHNVGFMVLDGLAWQVQNLKLKVQNCNSKFKIIKKYKSEVLEVGDIVLAKPQIFMNRSGEAVKKLVTSYNLPVGKARLQVISLFVVHDDLDIELGKYKIQFGKGPRKHNGLQSIYGRLGTKDFWHIRIGIEHRAKGKECRVSGEEYVLQRFTKEEREVIEQVVSEVGAVLKKRLLEDPF